jgi:hypothetical protein
MTIELLSFEVRKVVNMLKKEGEGSMSVPEKIAALQQAISRFDEHLVNAARVLDQINEGERTFSSQAVARSQQSRFVTEVAYCENRIDELKSMLREYDRSDPGLFDAPMSTHTGEGHTCKACGKPVHLDPIPQVVGGPIAKALHKALVGISAHVIHDQCVERARRRSRWAFGQG